MIRLLLWLTKRLWINLLWIHFMASWHFSEGRVWKKFPEVHIVSWKCLSSLLTPVRYFLWTTGNFVQAEAVKEMLGYHAVCLTSVSNERFMGITFPTGPSGTSWWYHCDKGQRVANMSVQLLTRCKHNYFFSAPDCPSGFTLHRGRLSFWSWTMARGREDFLPV